MADRIAVVSGKGGAGKSTCTVLIGRALTQLGKRVLLVDCDIGLKSLEVFANVRQYVVYHWGDVLAGACRAADAIIACGQGFDLLPAPPRLPESVSVAQFQTMIDALDALYDVILLDGPAGIGRGFRLVTAPARKALFVTAPDDVSLGACAAAVSALEDRGQINARLIMNHFRLKAVKKSLQKNIDDSIDKAGVRLIGIMPEDPNLWYFGSEGLLPKAKSPAIQASVRIAGRLLGQSISLKISDLK